MKNHKVLREVAIGIAFGLAVEFVLVPLLFSNTQLLREFGDKLADNAIRIHERWTSTEEHATPFVFVDIDDETWRRWDYPLVTPRDKLAAILDRVVASQPVAVVVDVDLAWPDKPRTLNEGTPPLDLATFLARDNAKGPPILLVRGLISRAPDDPDQWPRLQPTPFDEVVKAEPGAGSLSVQTRPGYRWVSPLFERDGDGVVRHARLFDFVCDGDAPVALPSAQLMAAASGIDARRSSQGPSVADAIMAAIGRLIPDRCGAEPSAALRRALPQKVSGHPEIELSLKESSARVIYTIAWKAKATALGPSVRDGEGVRPLVSVRPAYLVAGAEPGQPIDGLQGRIVLVGGSFRDSGDWHNTPLGAMPGALLIINAAHALGQFGTPREPPWWIGLPISLGIIVVVAYLFARLRPFGASLISSLFLLLLTIPSAFLFKSGVMLDLAVPSFGVFAHKFLIEIIQRVKLIMDKGFIALLADHDKD